jgi:hypothetical protein
MTRNQQSPKLRSNLSSGVIFTVAGDGSITPTATQTVKHGDSISIQKDQTSSSEFTGYVCAKQGGVCQCANLVTDLDGELHMEPGQYEISSNAVVDSHYTVYGEPDSGASPDATNGDIFIGST